MLFNPTFSRSKTWLTVGLGGALLMAPVAGMRPAHAFGGEDPLAPEGPMAGQPHNPKKEWHHEAITEAGAMAYGFSAQAADSLAWNVDYLDSYLYNPLWWAQGGLNRLKASMAQEEQLKKCHFDDLFDTTKINMMWRRYASGTFAGLVWAAQKKDKNNNVGDVAAAQHILGASLHAVQDFYSHSNWIDKPERRDTTFFQTPLANRTNQALYTGAYEHEEHNGVKHHGKWLYSAAVFRRPGVSTVMDVACSAVSPLAGDPVCQQYKLSKTGQSVQPDVAGVPLPADILVMAPKGIAVDNTWSAEIGVKQRGLTDLTGVQAYETARKLAVLQTTQWLETMGKAMASAGYASFWDKVKQNGVSMEDRREQYENLNKVAHTFLSEGVYPPTSPAEEYFLRVNIKTGTQQGAGTDADIQLKANNQSYLLDWMPRKIPGLAVNDFEAGDDDSYTVGPFASLPREIELYNNSASNMEVVKAAGRAFVSAVNTAVSKVGSVLSALTAAQADLIATNKIVWMPEEIDTLTPTPKNFTIELNGGGEGHYRVLGNIAKVGQDESNWIVEVKLNTLECVQESKWDRGSNSDEPFILSVLNPLPGPVQPYRTEPFDDVDSKETRSIGKTFAQVAIPKGAGMLNLAVCAMEHDDESRGKRDELLNKFSGQNEEATADAERDFLTAFGAAIAEDWRPAHLTVTAFSRMGRVQVGTVYDADVTRWIKGKESAKFSLDASKLRQVALTDQLLPVLPGPATQPGNTTSPPPGTPTGPTTPEIPVSNADLSQWEGTWAVNWGTLTLAKTGDRLKGSIKGPNPVTRVEVENTTLEVGSVGDGVTVEGRWQMPNSQTAKGDMHWTLSEDGMTFTGYSTNEMFTGAQAEQTPFTGRRLSPKPGTGTNPGTGTGTSPTTPGNSIPGNTVPGTIPGTTPGTGNAGSITGGQSASIGQFVSLPTFDARIDKVQLNRSGTSLEVYATFKNPSNRAERLLANTFDFILTDVDGIGMRSVGNLYAYEATSDQPVSSLTAEPSGEIKARFLVELPNGMAPFRTLSVRESNSRAFVFDLSGIAFPGAGPAASFEGLASSTSAFRNVTEIWDVRFDGIKRSRNGGFEAFATVKNVSEKAAGLLPYSVFDTFLHDGAQGSKKADGNSYRISGNKALAWSRTILVEPGVEAKIAFVFNATPDFNPTRITFKDRYSENLLDIPVSIPQP